MPHKLKRKEVDVTEKFRPGFSIKDFKFTDKQRELVRIIRNENSRVIFIQGPSGTSKSFLSVFCGLMAIREKSKEKLLYIRANVEACESKLGYLPGDLNQKSSPFCQALYQKLDELLEGSVAEKLIEEEIIKSIPPNFLRGVTFSNQFVILDEAQELSKKDLVTVLTRIGENCTLVICGDEMQSDIRNSGLKTMIRIFDDDESRERGIHSFQFTSEDIMRSEILKYIVSRLETAS